MFRRWNGVIGNRIQCMYVVPSFWNFCLKILGIYSTKRKYILCFYSFFLKIPLKGRVELRLIHNFLQIPNYIKFLRLMLEISTYLTCKICISAYLIFHKNIYRRNLHVDFDNKMCKKNPRILFEQLVNHPWSKFVSVILSDFIVVCPCNTNKCATIICWLILAVKKPTTRSNKICYDTIISRKGNRIM